MEIDGEETRSVDSSGSGDDDEGSEEQGEAGKDGEETRSAGNEEIGWLDAGWGWEGRSVSTSSTIVPIGTILASHVVHRKDGRHTHGVGCGFERACAGPLLGRPIPPAHSLHTPSHSQSTTYTGPILAQIIDSGSHADHARLFIHRSSRYERWFTVCRTMPIGNELAVYCRFCGYGDRQDTAKSPTSQAPGPVFTPRRWFHMEQNRNEPSAARLLGELLGSGAERNDRKANRIWVWVHSGGSGWWGLGKWWGLSWFIQDRLPA